ncbi:hypothetical protein B4129_0884 [Bacillus safensis]|nr:hypothetical protein B4129_0884 [Bacillus safensis]
MHTSSFLQNEFIIQLGLVILNMMKDHHDQMEGFVCLKKEKV